MTAARGMSDVFFAALTIAASACGSFGEGSDPQSTPSATDGGASDASVAPDGGSEAGPQGCPTDALACHFFEGALVEDPWVAEGRTKGAGLLEIRKAEGRSFVRIGATDAPEAALPFEETLLAILPPQAAVTISFDIRIDTIDPSQLIELVTVTYLVSSSEYRFTHFILAGRQPRITEFAEPSKASADVGTSSPLSPGWHHVDFTVDHVAATTSLFVDNGKVISGLLAFTPATSATQCQIKVGFNHTKAWRGPIAVDLDSVVAKPLR